MKTVLDMDMDDEDNTSTLLRIAAEPEPEPVRIEGYGDFVVPCYAEATFREHFRMTRSTFPVVCIL